jgi:general secretion pathway protein G
MRSDESAGAQPRSPIGSIGGRLRHARGSSFAAARGRSGVSGFTLIELLIVIALITILATMGIVQYRNSIQSTRESVLHTDLFRMRDAIDQYYADKAKYPASLDALVTDGYMRKIPEDPMTKSADTWQTVPAEPDPSNPSTDPGIYNVKSGAEGTALDGSSYSDW